MPFPKCISGILLIILCQIADVFSFQLDNQINIVSLIIIQNFYNNALKLCVEKR